jgi:hypothetical protein
MFGSACSARAWPRPSAAKALPNRNNRLILLMIDIGGIEPPPPSVGNG